MCIYNVTVFVYFRYKVYLEPEEDENIQKCHIITEGEQIQQGNHIRIPLQEKPLESFSSRSVHTNRIATTATPRSILQRQQNSAKIPLTSNENQSTYSEGGSLLNHKVTTSKKTSRRSHGGGLTSDNGNRVLRMGTRLSLSALHRERLRLTSEIGCLLPSTSIPQSVSNVFATRAMDGFEDITMETKSLLDRVDGKNISVQAKDPFPTAYVIHTSLNDSQLDIDSAVALPYNPEEIDESLNERFNAMETDGMPERKIVSVKLLKDENGRLGLKITGTPDGIYVEDFSTETVQFERDNNERKKLKQGDRILAINGRDLTNISYSNALDLIRRSGNAVEFVVSQINVDEDL